MTPLLLLPGLLCTRELWAPQIAALAERCAATVADLTLDESVSAMAARSLAAAPERFALAGLSMGGYVAQEIMRQAPGRVIRLALLDTSARPDDEEQQKRRRALIALSRRGRFRGVTPRLLPMLIHPDRMADAALTAKIMGMAEAVGQAAFARQQTAILDRPDGRHDLARIACPTLVVCGEDDQLTPPALAREMAEAIPGATLRLLPQCGHLSTLEQPALVNAALLEWLGRP